MPRDNQLPEGETYLGDGIYVSFDGFNIWLRAPREEGDHKVAFEPQTYKAFQVWLGRFPRLKEFYEKGR